MATGKKTGGRQKGTPNKKTAEMLRLATIESQELGRQSDRLLNVIESEPSIVPNEPQAQK